MTVVDFMVFTDPDVYKGGVTASRPTFTDTRPVPPDSNPELTGCKVAINQAAAQVYVSVIFWQAPEQQYNQGWLWTFDAQKNAIVSEIIYPQNTAGYLDFKTELVYSAARQTLHGTSFNNAFKPT